MSNMSGKSVIILISTFLLGGIVGVLLFGSFTHRSVERSHDPGHERRFVHHLERVLRLNDDQQKENVREIIRETAKDNRQVLEGAHADLQERFDSMVVQLEPFLDQDQIQRLKGMRDKLGGRRDRIREKREKQRGRSK